MNNFEKTIEAVKLFILGDRRQLNERRVKKSKRKNTRRKTIRRT